MLLRKALLCALALAVGVRGQGAGTLTSEYHPPLTTQACTSSGCSPVSSSITIDANWRFAPPTI